ncbi:MAG TPA: hypothetical protein VM689_06510 [Aliidongia sp.]|nr:hypothetical protein [Aliidongia sp.]
MPFAIEGTDPSAGGDTPSNFTLVANRLRGVIDVTVYSDGGAANSFDLFLPTPSTAIALARSVNFDCGERICGEGRMIVFVGTLPMLPAFSSMERSR